MSPPNKTESKSPELGKLLDRIRPAIAHVERSQARDQLIEAAVEANVCASVRQLRQVSSIAAAIKEKNVQVVGAVYHIDSGKLTFLDK